MAEALTEEQRVYLRKFEFNAVSVINELIIAHTPKLIWLTLTQMMQLRTCFSFDQWRDMQISEPGKFGIMYCKTEILMNETPEKSHVDEIDFSSGYPVPVEKKS